MNSQFLSFLIPFMVVLFHLMLWRIWKKSKTSKLPPGPPKLPIIGNMYQFIGCLAHHKLRDLAKKYGPIMHLQFGQVSTVVISSPETAKEIMKTHDAIFAHRPFLLVAKIIFYNRADILYASLGDHWRQLRKICISELLSPKRVLWTRSIREAEVTNLIRSISSNAGSPVNLSKMLLSLTCSIVARTAFGKKCKDQEAFILIAEEVLKMMAGFNLADLFPSVKLLDVISGIRPRLEKLHEELDIMLEDIINDHSMYRSKTKVEGGDEADDLVHTLLNLQEQGTLELPLTTDNIKAVILDMFIAGTDTSTTVLEWAMSEMIKNSQVMHKAQAEVRHVLNGKADVDETSIDQMKYLKLIVKETLRLHPPAPLLPPRESIEQCKIKGYNIPMKTRVFVNAWAVGRDPNYWNEAEKFYPERFLDSPIDYKGGDFQFFPFGAGRRKCPGLSYGIANVELPLAQLLYYFDWELLNGVKKENLDMTEDFGAVVRRKNDLCLIPIPRHQLPAE